MSQIEVSIDEALFESTIDEVLNILQPKHNNYTSEPFCHYVVKGEDEEECDSDEYCENCIEAAVMEFSKNYKKKRQHELNKIRDLRKWGYCFSFHYSSHYGQRMLHIVATPSEIDNHERWVLDKYPQDVTFSYRYYRLDFQSSCQICENCGIIIDSCVTAVCPPM